MKKLLKKLFPICRSITGKGLLKSLKIIKDKNKLIKIKSFKSGTRVFDWKIPPEWNVKDAYIANEKNERVVDFKKNNLHLISYSIPIKKKIKVSELMSRIHSLPKQMNYIPYLTSYYKKYWGFAIKHNLKEKLFKNKKEKFFVNIETKFNRNGKMHYAECLIKGKSKKEILITTYLCHPSMANNELSGPIVWKYLLEYFKKKKNRYSLRFVITPETIGSISYISKNYKSLKANIIGGYVLTCLGDKGDFSYLNSRNENSISDLVVSRYFDKKNIKYKNYSYLDRGSDERQYNHPKIDLSLGSIMRTKYGKFSQYHTSGDNLDFVKSKNLKKSFKVCKEIIEEFMKIHIPENKISCEPFLTKHNLYPTLSTKKVDKTSKNILNFLSYSDGKNDLISIAKKIQLSLSQTKKIYKILILKRLIKF